MNKWSCSFPCTSLGPSLLVITTLVKIKTHFFRFGWCDDWSLKSSSEPGTLMEWGCHGDPRQSWMPWIGGCLFPAPPPSTPTHLTKRIPADKQLHLFSMAWGLNLDQDWCADGMHCEGSAGCRYLEYQPNLRPKGNKLPRGTDHCLMQWRNF